MGEPVRVTLLQARFFPGGEAGAAFTVRGLWSSLCNNRLVVRESLGHSRYYILQLV